MLKHEHSGKLRPHHHTSYASLVFLLIVAMVLVLGLSWTASAATPAVNPQSGAVGLTGVVRGAAPTTAAVIVVPTGGAYSSTSPVTVSGTCPKGTFVDIRKNNVFAGVVVCQDDGSFSLLVDLFDGANRLVARVSDALGQFGPDSAAVDTFYDAPSLKVGGAQGKQLFLKMDSTVVGGDPGQNITRSAIIVGGVAPYAVSWDWGDNATSLASVTNEGAISGTHMYDRAGTYRVILRVTDSAGNSAYVQFVTVVNGATAQVTNTTNAGALLPGALVAVWPLLILALMMVVAFWLGERREISKLRAIRD
jgi:hypothetical protein